MSAQLTVINPKVDKRWDEFVCAHPRGSIYHHSMWGQVIESTYGYVPFYVALERMETGRLEGVLPFLLVTSVLTGKRLVSLPLTAYCDQLFPERELANVMRFVSDHHDIDHVELRFPESTGQVSGIFERRLSYVTHILDLRVGLEELFKSFHPSSVRRRITKAERNGLKLRMAEEEKDLRRFYELETTIRQKHGLCPQPYAFFANMWRLLTPRKFLLVPLLEHEGKIVAAAMVLRFNKTFHYEYGVSDQNFRQLNPEHKLIWEVINIAHRERVEYLDFGRSSLINRSLIEFKERWGARRQNLVYYHFPKAKRIGVVNRLGWKMLYCVNGYLPRRLLQLEGKVLYPHVG